MFTQSFKSLGRKNADQKRDDGVFVPFPITNRDFANMISTSRESISRTLNQLKRDHLLETNRDGIRICERRENGY
ncbi:helix-turn-helix domain-containing protein [Novibacillus thermophilus]|uniref:HTH crp-type domain-containing protein n=1 Tax=Novibacillus thermophilus TaxID=1471761 RepID=A0A1U9K3J0_9BACL|nr:helix-turn-helix domain-containing protein [Novibacillus thermophilus]AQS54594.1 hypothetical protein B0W44_01095 [Novibacillus thermophilus]